MDLRSQQLKLYIRGVFGPDQVDLFRFSWKSLQDRINFASYHLHEAKRLVLPYTSSAGPQPGLDRIFSVAIAHAQAHVTACLQSLHAVGDICSHGVYFALGANLEGPPLDERRIDCHNVSQNIRDERVATAFSCLIDHEDFQYLQAVVNRSKHRTVVTTNYTFDSLERDQMSGWHGLSIWRFEHHDREYPVRRAEEFLSGELSRQRSALSAVAGALEQSVKEKLDGLKESHGAGWPMPFVPEEGD